MGLVDSLEDRIIVALRRIMRAVDLHSRWLVERYGLTGPQLITLQRAAQHDGASAGELARHVNLSHPTLTGILDRLEKRGLVTRVPTESDRRRVSVRVTPRGREVLSSAPPPLQERFRNELAKQEEWVQTSMLSTLQRIARMMDADTLDVSPILETGDLGRDIEPPADGGASAAGPPRRRRTTTQAADSRGPSVHAGTSEHAGRAGTMARKRRPVGRTGEEQ